MPVGPDDPQPILEPVRLRHLQQRSDEGGRAAMLTCYDHTTAAHLQQCGVEILLVGDSAANVILGHGRTTAVDLPFMITLTQAVRRGAPNCFVMADMPFGSYQGSRGRAIDNVCRMVRETGCDAVKLEATDWEKVLVARLADAGVAVCAHLGLRPQTAQVSGYRVAARSDDDAAALAETAADFEAMGAAMILLEAVPPAASRQVCEAVGVPVIGCGAGPAPFAHVVVLQDLLGLSPRRPRFVPDLGQPSLRDAATGWVGMVRDGSYPAPEHCYE